jgi:deoxyhypusine synthase
LLLGYDFNKGVNYDELVASFMTTGFQATNFGLAVKEINAMVCSGAEPPTVPATRSGSPHPPPGPLAGQQLNWTLADDPYKDTDGEEFQDIEARKKVRSTVFLGYTSNMISSGVRESIRFLAQHRMVYAILLPPCPPKNPLIRPTGPLEPLLHQMLFGLARQVDVMVTTCGGIEEDFMKVVAPGSTAACACSFHQRTLGSFWVCGLVLVRWAA